MSGQPSLELVNDRPSYEMYGCPSHALWYNGNGVWYCGNSRDLGKPCGLIQAEDTAPCPELITAPWRVWDQAAAAWHTATTLHCHAASSTHIEEAKASVEAKLATIAGGATSVRLAGSIDLPSVDAEHDARVEHIRGAYPGVFDRRDAPLVNDRPSYAMRGTNQMLYYNGAGVWHFGGSDDLGQARGYLQALDDALVPELIVSPWQLWYGSMWRTAPNLRCAPLRRTRAAAA